MKLRFFLRGFGVGIVLTAILLCVSYRSGRTSGGDIVEEAKKLGMVFPEGTQATEVNESTAMPTVTPARQEERIVSGAGVTGKPKEETGKTAKPTQKPTTKPTQKPTQKPTTKPAPKTNKSGIKFTVRNGLLSSSVSREMKEAGIIKDADAFDEYLEKNRYGRKVRSGTYFIPIGASYEEIAKIITREK